MTLLTTINIFKNQTVLLMMIEEMDGAQNIVDSSKLFQKSQTDFMTMIEEGDDAQNLVDNKK